MNLDRPTPPDPYAQLPAVPSFTVEADFADGSTLPDTHVYAEGNTSPRLRWSGAPAGTKSYVVSCYDPDAPTPSGFWHWFVVNVPGDVTELEEGAGVAKSAGLPKGALHLANDFGSRDFGGAAPPPGDRPHRYIFAVSALDVDKVDLEPDTSPAKASFLMLEHVIGRGLITGLYAAS